MADIDFDFAKCARVLFPELFLNVTDSFDAAARMDAMARSKKTPEELFDLQHVRDMSTTAKDVLINCFSKQIATVIISTETIVERALALLIRRNESESCLLPVRMDELKDAVDTILLDVITVYASSAKNYFLTLDYSQHDIDTSSPSTTERHWSVQSKSRPLESEFFGYQTGCQTGGAVECWSDVGLRLFNVSKIFGDFQSRFTPKLQRYTTDAVVIAMFPIYDLDFTKPPQTFMGNVVNAKSTDTRIFVKFDTPHVMGQIAMIFESTGSKGGDKYAAMIETAAPYINSVLANAIDAHGNEILARVTNIDGSTAYLCDVAALHSGTNPLTVSGMRNALDCFPPDMRNMPSLHGRLKTIIKGKTFSGLNFVANFNANMINELTKYLIDTSKYTPIKEVAKSQAFLASSVMTSYLSLRFANVSYGMATKMASTGAISTATINYTPNELVEFGVKWTVINSREHLSIDADEIVQGTPFRVSDVSDTVLLDYAVSARLIAQDVCRLDVSPSNTAVLITCSRELVGMNSTVKDAGMEKYLKKEMFEICSDTTFRDAHRTTRNAFTARNSKKPIFKVIYLPQSTNNNNNDDETFFRGTLSPSVAVCAYGCGRLYADAGIDLWDKIVRPNLVLFKDLMQDAFMATMYFTVLADAVARKKTNNKTGSGSGGLAVAHNVKRPLNNEERFHTWAFAVIHRNSRDKDQLRAFHDLQSIKNATNNARADAKLLTDAIPIVDGVTVSLSHTHISIYFDNWTADAIELYLKSMMWRFTGGSGSMQIPVDDIRVQMSDRSIPVRFRNLVHE